MSQPVLLKVYGNISPVDGAFALALRESCAMAMPLDAENPPTSLQGNLFLLSFEGVFFPIDDFITVLEGGLTPEMTGKVDYLDLENWQMTRYLPVDGKLSVKTVSLNHVLDYSGF